MISEALTNDDKINVSMHSVSKRVCVCVCAFLRVSRLSAVFVLRTCGCSKPVFRNVWD